MTLYDVLGCRPDASDADLHDGYLQRAKRFHPDQHAGSPRRVVAWATERMSEVNEAWGVLGDPRSRAAYDHALARGADDVRERGTRPRGNAPRRTPPRAATRGSAGLRVATRREETAIGRELLRSLGRGWTVASVALALRTDAGGDTYRPQFHLRCFDADAWPRLGLADVRHAWGVSTHQRGVGDGVLGSLSSCRELAHLDLSSTSVRRLPGIGSLDRLEDLDVSFSGAGDDAMSAIAALHGLRTLAVVDCDVTDTGLARLLGLPRLRTLVLRGTRITPDGVRSLARLPALRTLALPRRLWWTWWRDVRARRPDVELC